MKDAQLEKMSIPELIDLKGRIDTMISSKQEREKIELREKVEVMAREAGLSIGDLFGGKTGRKGKSVGGIRFRHPDDPSLTWSGRGRKPKWLVQAGGDPERFRIR